jgi:hypothetical protein
MLSDLPPMTKAMKAPVTLKGRARRTVNGWMKLLNCDASTM